jgi:hypothetical protein
MRQSSSAFSPTLVASHTVSATVSPFYGTVSPIDSVPISEGTLTVDVSQLIQSSLSVTIPRFYTDPAGVRWDLLPQSDDAAFACNGQRLRLNYTIGRPGGFSETIPLGQFRISDWQENGAELQVNATSLEALIDEYRFIGVKELAGGMTLPSAINTIVAGVLPIRYVTVTGTIAASAYEDNRLEALNSLLTDFGGYRVRVDDSGILEIAPAWNDRTDIAVGALVDGDNGTVVQSPTQGNRDSVYNAVNASGESQADTVPVNATAYQNTGPRAWNGVYGNVPYFYVSKYLTTVAQCLATAQKMLANLQVRALPVAIDAVPDPRWQIGDVLSLNYRGSISLIRIDSINLPLTAAGGAMTLTGHTLNR